MKRLLFIYMLIAAASCKKLIEIGPPVDQLASNSVFLDTMTADAALVGMYAKVANPFPGNDIGSGSTMFNSMSADETYCYAFNFYDAFTNNALTSQIYYVDAIWSKLYSDIYSANDIIEGVTRSSLPDGFKKRTTGEAKFIRALSYFYLVNEYGPVPLVLSTDVHKTTNQPRDSVSIVYDQIEKDLAEAQQALPSNLDIYGGKRTRATSWAAAALLARVYLYRNKWQQAESMATTVINNPGLFRMNDDLSTVFLANSEEGILQYINAISQSWVASNFVPYPGSPTPKFVIKDALYADFESGDKRKSNWVGIKSYGGVDYPYPAKYKFLSSAGPVEYLQVLRLSEQYLIRAEARMQQGNYLTAAEDIDVVRLRAGLPRVTAADKPTLTNAIEHERRIEFFCEWGQRWLDLKRWPGITNPAATRADEVLKADKGDKWQSTDALYPLPQSAINSNVHLTQNHGY